jgi:hypothetical protein
MSLTDRITFVVAVNDAGILARNLLASPCLRAPHNHQVLIQEHYPSAAKAYNAAIRRASNELLIFVHQDIFLPESWMSQLERSLLYLQGADPNWGVLGCWGATRQRNYLGHVFSSGWGVLGRSFDYPKPVQTLDEIVLIFKRGSGLAFDEDLPHYHFYGTDICMRAAKCGRLSYTMPAFCIHNTTQILRLPKEFYRCYSHIRRTWKDDLPIQTTCMRVTKSNSEMYRRRFHDFCLNWFHKVPPVSRVVDPTSILRGLERSKS